MPNNKKNRKNKEKKAAAAAVTTTTAAAAATTPPSSSTTTTAAESPVLRPCPHNPVLPPCPHNPACCDKCFLAYPPGCLHTLREEERNSPEMNECLRVLLDAIASSKDVLRYDTSVFWIRPENMRFLAANHDRMVRLCLHEAIRVIVGKESLFPQQEGEEEEDNTSLTLAETMARFFINHMAAAYRILQCEAELLLCVNETEKELFKAKNLESFEELCAVIAELQHNSYHRLVYTLNELSPCDCLKAEVERSRQEAEQHEQQQAAEGGQPSSMLSCLMHCFNPGCDKKESSCSDNDKFSVCAGCKIVHYCSRRCYKDHWRGDTIMIMTTGGGSPGAPARPHKIACEAIQELKSVLAGRGAVRRAMGRDDSA